MDSGTIRFAYAVLPLLVIVLAVAVVAYGSQSRTVFLLGLIGSLTSPLVPIPREYADCRSVEAAVMASYEQAMEHSITSGVMCALAGIFLGFVVLRAWNNEVLSDATGNWN